jgi:hypothetical protein
MAGPREIRNVIARLPEHARLAVGTITRAAFTTGLNRILLGAAVIALVSGVVSLAATALKFPELCVRVSGFPGLGYGLAAC